jgi:hypothetical protein
MTLGTSIRLYFDHDVDVRLAEALRRRSFDVETAFQVGLHEADDPSQLTYATQNGRILMTHNVRHFPGIYASWLTEERHHSGIIILIGYPSIGVWLERTLKLFSVFDAADLRDQLFYLSADFD